MYLLVEFKSYDYYQKKRKMPSLVDTAVTPLLPSTKCDEHADAKTLFSPI